MTWDPKFIALVMFPPSGPSPDASLPSTGFRRLVPRFHRYYQGAATSYRSSRRTSLPSLGGTIRCTLVSFPQCGVRHRGPGDFACTHRLPRPVDSVETAGSLTFPGNPHCAYALLSDPGRIVAPTRPITMQRCSPRSNHDKGSHDYHFRGSITRPRHSLSTLRRVDHSTTRQDSLQAVGQTLPDGLSPAGFLRKVSEFNYISSSFPELS